jgi:hypothetical protein
LRRVAVRTIPVLLLAAALAWARGGTAPAAPKPAAVARPENPWTEIVRPIALYSLETPDFGREPRLYEARRHATGGGRQDILTFGPADLGAGPALRIDLYREGAEEVPDSPFFADIARQAALAGFAVIRSALPDALPTRFGTFEAADVMLSEGKTETACLGFRLLADKAGLRITGFACGGQKPINRPTLACALGRLDLLAARENGDLTRFFVAAEQNRGKFCPLNKAGPGAKITWLDPRANLPPLRASVAPGKVPPRR